MRHSTPNKYGCQLKNESSANSTKGKRRPSKHCSPIAKHVQTATKHWTMEVPIDTWGKRFWPRGNFIFILFCFIMFFVVTKLCKIGKASQEVSTILLPQEPKLNEL